MQEAAELLAVILSKGLATTPTGAVNLVLKQLRDRCFLSFEDIHELYGLAKEQFDNGLTVKFFLKEDEYAEI